MFYDKRQYGYKVVGWSTLDYKLMVVDMDYGERPVTLGETGICTVLFPRFLKCGRRG